MIKKIKESLQNLVKPKELREWFHVTTDENGINWNVEPPGKKPWTQQLAWDHIECVCFKANDFLESDEIIIFSDIRPESYLIPTEAKGGQKVLSALIERKLFDAELTIKAASLPSGMLCDPDLEEYAERKKHNNSAQ